jgi:hypothetical protein
MDYRIPDRELLDRDDPDDRGCDTDDRLDGRDDARGDCVTDRLGAGAETLGEETLGGAADVRRGAGLEDLGDEIEGLLGGE